MRSDYITFLSQCNAREIQARLFPGKASSHIVQRYHIFPPTSMQCFRVPIPPAVIKAYSFTTDGYGIFNVRTHLGAVPYTRRAGSDTKKSAQELTRRDRKNCPSAVDWALTANYLSLYLSSPCSARGLNLIRSSDLNSDSLTTESTSTRATKLQTRVTASTAWKDPCG